MKTRGLVQGLLVYDTQENGKRFVQFVPSMLICVCMCATMMMVIMMWMMKTMLTSMDVHTHVCVDDADDLIILNSCFMVPGIF